MAGSSTVATTLPVSLSSTTVLVGMSSCQAMQRAIGRPLNPLVNSWKGLSLSGNWVSTK